jgi:hypothetical protein
MSRSSSGNRGFQDLFVTERSIAISFSSLMGFSRICALAETIGKSE